MAINRLAIISSDSDYATKSQLSTEAIVFWIMCSVRQHFIFDWVSWQTPSASSAIRIW